MHSSSLLRAASRTPSSQSQLVGRRQRLYNKKPFSPVKSLPAAVKQSTAVRTKQQTTSAPKTTKQTPRSAFPLQLPEILGLRTNETLLFAAQVVDLLALVGVIHVAYSGFWSQIGLLTQAQEMAVQSFIPIELSLHGVCAVVAALSAAAMEKDAAVAALKGFFFGIVGVYEYSVPPEPSAK